MAIRKEFKWVEEIEYKEDGLETVNGHELGARLYRGYDGDDPNPKKTIRIQITEKDLHGVVKTYRTKNFETQKAENLQIILPDDLKFVKKLGKFILAAVKNAEDETMAKLEKLKEEAAKAGLDISEKSKKKEVPA